MGKKNQREKGREVEAAGGRRRARVAGEHRGAAYIGQVGLV